MRSKRPRRPCGDRVQLCVAWPEHPRPHVLVLKPREGPGWQWWPCPLLLRGTIGPGLLRGAPHALSAQPLPTAGQQVRGLLGPRWRASGWRQTPREALRWLRSPGQTAGGGPRRGKGDSSLFSRCPLRHGGTRARVSGAARAPRPVASEDPSARVARQRAADTGAWSLGAAVFMQLKAERGRSGLQSRPWRQGQGAGWGRDGQAGLGERLPTRLGPALPPAPALSCCPR